MNEPKQEIHMGSIDIRSSIDEIISFLIKVKEDGAVGCKLSKTGGNGEWEFLFIETFRYITLEEIKQEKIKKLKKELEELESK